MALALVFLEGSNQQLYFCGDRLQQTGRLYGYLDSLGYWGLLLTSLTACCAGLPSGDMAKGDGL